MKTHFARSSTGRLPKARTGSFRAGPPARSRDAGFRRASPGDRDYGRSGAGARPRHRRLRKLFDRRDHREDARSRRTPAPTQRSSWSLITTSRARPGWPPTSGRSAESSDLPIIVYNVPSRTVADISVETLAEVREAPDHRRSEGRDRQSRPRHRAAAGLRRGRSPSCPATTTWRSASTRWAASAAFR